jgi:hypothetical protein
MTVVRLNEPQVFKFDDLPQIPRIFAVGVSRKQAAALFAPAYARVVASSDASASGFPRYAGRLLTSGFTCSDLCVRLLAAESLASRHFLISFEANAASVELFGVLWDSDDRDQCFDMANSRAVFFQRSADIGWTKNPCDCGHQRAHQSNSRCTRRSSGDLTKWKRTARASHRKSPLQH